MKYIASVSFGKDSLAMLLKIIDLKLPIDEVVFYDTGMEFDEIYKTRDRVLPLLKEHNIKYVELKPSRPFIETMINYPHFSRKGLFKKGYGWCGGLCRWGTTEKLKSINNYCKNAYQYVGIAFDEPKRIERLTPNKIPLLYKLRMTEDECLHYCYSRGFDWNGLYLYLDRVSCWCCRNKNLKELRNYKKHLTKYYNMLVDLEEIIGVPMKPPLFLKERFKD